MRLTYEGKINPNPLKETVKKFIRGMKILSDTKFFE